MIDYSHEYEDIRKLLYAIINDKPCFCGRCSFDDRLSAANYGYVKACQSFDPTCRLCEMMFSTYLWRVVQNTLSAECKQNLRHAHVNLKHDPKTPTSIVDRLWELSDDARSIFFLLVDSNDDIRSLWMSARVGKARRAMVQSYLYGKGWSMRQTARAFRELTEALR